MLDRLIGWSPNLGLDTFLLLPVLIALEAVLSADNAIALAVIAQGLGSDEQQKRALNVGLVAAFGLRVSLILTATWVLQYWQFEVAGAAYLLWLVYQHFTAEEDSHHHHHGPQFASLWQAVPIIAFTDLAFSLDSVTTAIALSDQVFVVLLGGLIGIITLRCMAGLFIRWLNEYEYLEDAGFVTVAFVGVRLLLRVITPDLVPPDWLMVSLIMILFIWGFSKRTEAEADEVTTDDVIPAENASPSSEFTPSTETVDTAIQPALSTSNGHSVDHLTATPATSTDEPTASTDAKEPELTSPRVETGGF